VPWSLAVNAMLCVCACVCVCVRARVRVRVRVLMCVVDWRTRLAISGQNFVSAHFASL
jgi:hypothetical protein